MTADAVAGRRRAQSLDGAWDFVHEDDGVARTAPVPAPWQAAHPDLRWRSGTVTYSRRFARPEGSAGREVALRFGAASYLAEVRVNGEHRRVNAGTTLLELAGELGLDPARIAVERNMAVVPRSTLGDVRVEDGDDLEIVTFVGGG